VYYLLKANPEIVGALGRTLKAEEVDLRKELFISFAGQGECSRSWEGCFAGRYERNAAAPVQIVCLSAEYPMGQFQRHERHLGTQVPLKVIDLKKSPPVCSVHKKVYLTCGHDMTAVPLCFCSERFEGKQLAVRLVKLRATDLKLPPYSERCLCKNSTFLLNGSILSG